MLGYKTVVLKQKDDTTYNKRTVNKRRKANTLEKSKELQPIAQCHRIAAYFLLPQPHNITFNKLN